MSKDEIAELDNQIHELKQRRDILLNEQVRIEQRKRQKILADIADLVRQAEQSIQEAANMAKDAGIQFSFGTEWNGVAAVFSHTAGEDWEASEEEAWDSSSMDC